MEVTIKWNESQNNGASITQYTVYQRTVSDDGTPRKWYTLYVMKDPSDRKVAVKLEKGKNYEFLVTATNRFGESLKKGENIKKIVVLGGKCMIIVLFKNMVMQCKEKTNLQITIISRLNFYKIATEILIY